jgi:isocitrate lyase
MNNSFVVRDFSINRRSHHMSQAPSQQLTREQQIAALEKDWATNPRWKGVKRGYTAADVVRLRGSLPIEHTLARRGAEKLGNHVPRPVAVRLRLGAHHGAPHQQHLQAR